MSVITCDSAKSFMNSRPSFIAASISSANFLLALRQREHVIREIPTFSYATSMMGNRRSCSRSACRSLSWRTLIVCALDMFFWIEAGKFMEAVDDELAVLGVNLDTDTDALRLFASEKCRA